MNRDAVEMLAKRVTASAVDRAEQVMNPYPRHFAIVVIAVELGEHVSRVVDVGTNVLNGADEVAKVIRQGLEIVVGQ